MFSWSKAEDDAVMAKLHAVHQKLAARGKLGPSARPPSLDPSLSRGEGRGHICGSVR